MVDYQCRVEGNVLGCRVSATSCRHLIYRLHKMRVNAATNDGLHHGEVFQIVVRLKQSIPGKELD